mgnify:CR=1 FL=1
MMARMGGEIQDWKLGEANPELTGTAWSSGEADESIFDSGHGTEEDPYVIKTADQLYKFASSLTENFDYSGLFVVLGDDIDASGRVWSPIGGSDYAFNGYFGGKGYEVSGLSIGSSDSPVTLAHGEPFVGFFGILGSDAVVKDLTVNAVFHVEYGASAYVGIIAGYMDGKRTNGDFTGAVIDNCKAYGSLSLVSEKGNQFVGGIVGMQYKGAIINCVSDVKLSGIVEAGDLAEVGGLVGINNRGLVANCRSDSVIYSSGNRENGNEGMAVASNLVACNAGMLVNCVASGRIVTREYSTYAGMVSGWVTGIGKSYLCWYDLSSSMLVGEVDVKQNVVPVEPIGTKVSSGVNDEGDAYTGGLVDRMTGYKSENASVADGLNANFDKFPAEISVWGISSDSLRTWTYDGEKVVLSDGFASVTYVKPDCENVVKPELKMNDGLWYGISGSTVVKVTAEDGVAIEIEVISGETSGDEYEAALKNASDKAVWGEFSHFFAADDTKFAGGKGTASDPYLISDEEQLRYLAYSINLDTKWEGKYFRQTADITLTDGDWLPIGWAINAEVDGKKKVVAAYPFKGNYDGGGFTITGLTIGSENTPADMMTAGFFGLVAGEFSTNELPNGERAVELKNIHLRQHRTIHGLRLKHASACAFSVILHKNS